MSALLRSHITPANHAPSGAVLAVIEGDRSRDEDGDLAALEAIGTCLRVAKNAAVFHEGELSEHVYKVAGGAMRTYRLLVDGRRQIADFILPGDFFGLDWQARHGFTAEALTDAEVIRYPRRRLEALAESRPSVQRLLRAMLCKRLAATQEHVVMLGRQTAFERLAWFLLRLNQRNGVTDEIDVPMSRQDIADYLGLTIETVSRGISEFKRRHYISAISTHRFRLADTAALRALANGEAAS